jgi:hypothetical protein
MPREPDQTLTCISCGNAEDPSSMIDVGLPHSAIGWPKSALLCRACAFAVATAANGSDEAPPASSHEGDTATSEEGDNSDPTTGSET